MVVVMMVVVVRRPVSTGHRDPRPESRPTCSCSVGEDVIVMLSAEHRRRLGCCRSGGSCSSRGHGAQHPEGLHRLALPAKAPRASPERTFFKHELGRGVNRPVVALTRATKTLRKLNEAFVKGEVVPDGVLPAVGRTSEEGKLLLEEMVDFAER